MLCTPGFVLFSCVCTFSSHNHSHHHRSLNRANATRATISSAPRTATQCAPGEKRDAIYSMPTMCVPVIKDEDRFSMADIFVWGEPREPERVTTEDLPGDRTPLCNRVLVAEKYKGYARVNPPFPRVRLQHTVPRRVLQAHRVTCECTCNSMVADTRRFLVRLGYAQSRPAPRGCKTVPDKRSTAASLPPLLVLPASRCGRAQEMTRSGAANNGVAPTALAPLGEHIIPRPAARVQWASPGWYGTSRPTASAKKKRPAPTDDPSAPRVKKERFTSPCAHRAYSKP